MSAAKVMFFSLLFCQLSDHGVQCTIECWTKDCSKEELCLPEDTNDSPTDECRFVVAMNEDCSFQGAMSGTYETTKEYLDNLQNSSSAELKFSGYTTSEDSLEPSNIFSNVAEYSSGWKLDESFASNSGCNDEFKKILCTLLRHPRDDDVNKTMCPDPITTTVLETTEGRTVFTNKAVSAAPARIETVPETTNDRTVFTNETVSAASAKKETTSVDDTTTSSATKVGIYIPVVVAMYFYQ